MLQATKVIACAAYNASRIRAWMVVLVLAFSRRRGRPIRAGHAFRTAVDNDMPPRVDGVYPSAERLPANLLRLLRVFSTPMAVGESAQLRLEDDRGRTVERAFLALDEEL